MKKLLKILFDALGYIVVKKSTLKKYALHNTDENFIEIYEKCRPYSMTTPERMYALYNAVQYVVANNIPGDFAECGVWKGGSAMVCALTLKSLNSTQRKIFLYDTYTGMTIPSAEDKEAMTGDSAVMHWKNSQCKDHNEWCYAPIEEVKKNMLLTRYPAENVVYVKGRVEDTIPSVIPKQISILRLDTDWYESTKYEMEQLFPIVSKGGVIIIDDYGHWTGAKKAVDEYFKKNNIRLLLNRIDYTGRIGVKW